MSNRFDTPNAEPVDPWMPVEESYPMAPARTIEITDEIRAQDAAQQAARGCEPDHPWAAVKASLRPGVLITRPHGNQEIVIGVRRECKGCGGGISTQSATGFCRACWQKRQPAAKPKAAKKPRPIVTVTVTAPPSPALIADLATMAEAAIEMHQNETTAPQPTTEEREPMTTTKQTECACGKPLSAADIAKGKTTAWGHGNGCPPAKKTAAKKSAAKKSVAKNPSLVSDAPPSLTLSTAITGSEDVVLLPVPAASLDAFWSRLSQAEKARIVSTELLQRYGLATLASEAQHG